MGKTRVVTVVYLLNAQRTVACSVCEAKKVLSLNKQQEVERGRVIF
jgi:hypothetical protein